MDLQYLREATSQEHQAVEGIMPVMNPDLTLAQYRTTLHGLYGILSAWDDWAAQHAPSHLAEQVASRRRSLLLAKDLGTLGDKIPVEKPNLALSADDASFLGSMYVIEGSTLGGQYIAKHLEKVLGLTVDSGAAYFVGYGEQTSLRWREFQDILREIPMHHTEEVVAGAKSMFLQFRTWMLREHKSNTAE